jgi:PadR family transcriptional regulator, regulatory protein AphA
MPFKVHKAYNTNYIECEPNDFIIRNERDVLELISVCVENDTNRVMLYEGNLSPEFFDLKTNLAGAVLQKFANYRLRGAAIISLDRLKSERFKELIFECNRGNLFRFFENRDAAEKWLESE